MHILQQFHLYVWPQVRAVTESGKISAHVVQSLKCRKTFTISNGLLFKFLTWMWCPLLYPRLPRVCTHTASAADELHIITHQFTVAARMICVPWTKSMNLLRNSYTHFQKSTSVPHNNVNSKEIATKNEKEDSNEREHPANKGGSLYVSNKVEDKWA